MSGVHYILNGSKEIVMSKKTMKKLVKSKIDHSYAIGFYDAFDGWWLPSETKAKRYKSLADAKTACDKKMKDLDENNKRMGEHYSVFDENEKEVYHGY
jgi:ABC-type proline/glycine betaine transport system substrate-binding protein